MRAEATRRMILVIHPGALGDVLLALPAIRALRTGWPGHAVGLLAGREAGALLQACREVETAIPIEGDFLACLLAGSEVANPTLRGVLRRCDLAVGWLADADGRLRTTLRTHGVGRTIVRSPAGWGDADRHQANRFLETLREVAPGGEYGCRLRVPDAVLANGRTHLAAAGAGAQSPVVAVHPGSGSRHKCADPALIAGLIERLRHRGFCPIVLGGPADGDAVARVMDACTGSPAVLQGLDLLSVAGVLVHAGLFVGHDSGLTHLAASLHLPTVALFGPTGRRRWAPRGAHVTILTGASCRCEGWDRVQACRDKPCLQVPSEVLMDACMRRLGPRTGALRQRQAVDGSPCYAP